MVEAEGGLGDRARRPAAQDPGAGRRWSCRRARWPRRSPANGATCGEDDRPARDAADRARQCRDRPGRARSGSASPPASRATPRATCSAIAPKGRRRWSSAQAESWDRAARLGAAALRCRFRDHHRDRSMSPSRRRRSRGSAMRSRRSTPFQLAALSPLVTIGGSLVAALAVLEGAMPRRDGVGGGQPRRALAARAMGRGCRGRGGARRRRARFPRRGAVPRAARARRGADQVADEGRPARPGARA